MTEYQYVGPIDLLDLIGKPSTRLLIQSEVDILSWVRQTHQKPDRAWGVVATFIIARDGNLWVADRHSEHVVCAAGSPVLSAGEITFQVIRGGVAVSAVTNQSTGFCPEPASWPCVAKALDKLGLVHPENFTSAFDFRQCDACGSINLIKDDWFVCGVCDADLDRSWNFPPRGERV